MTYRHDTSLKGFTRLVNNVLRRYHAAMNESARVLLDLVSCLGRVIQEDERRHALAAGLQSVHLTALSYLRDANRYSNTPHALTEFLGSTKGTVSQSLLLLYRKGLVERHADPQDGRVVRLRLSAAGKKLLQGAALDQQWEAAVGALSPADAALASQALATILRSLQRGRGSRTFGVCSTCTFFTRLGARSFRCGLTGESLSQSDSTKICREHMLPAHNPDPSVGK